MTVDPNANAYNALYDGWSPMLMPMHYMST